MIGLCGCCALLYCIRDHREQEDIRQRSYDAEIAVVDDDRAVVQLVTAFLEVQEYRTISCSQAAEAISLNNNQIFLVCFRRLHHTDSLPSQYHDLEQARKACKPGDGTNAIRV